VEAKTDVQSYLEQGKQALAQGQGREAAIAYAHAAQIEADNPMVHLGLAEANLALGNYGVAQMACRRVQELQPDGGIEGMTAQAILDLLDRRYERALQYADAVIAQDPGIPYVHALRSYLLRAQGQDYDANLARARAARLSYGGRFDGVFPALESHYSSSYIAHASAPSAPDNPASEAKSLASPSKAERESVPTWSRPNNIQRQMVRTRFFMNRYPGLITYIIIAINFIVYLGVALLAFRSGIGQAYLVGTNDPVVGHELFVLLEKCGMQDPTLILQGGQYWRILTAMFLHESLIHVALNMLSLFFIGRVVEILYGSWRYLLIYFLGGIGAGLTALFIAPTDVAGASGAIFAVFGALGMFYFLNRHSLGMYSRGAISNWVFWLVLNLVWGFSAGDVSMTAHIGGLVIGLILGWLLLPKMGRHSI
jgi:membrane associated rhomboid family serine protease